MQPGRWEKSSGMALIFLISQISLQSWERRGELEAAVCSRLCGLPTLVEEYFKWFFH